MPRLPGSVQPVATAQSAANVLAHGPAGRAGPLSFCTKSRLTETAISATLSNDPTQHDLFAAQAYFFA
jgi:hypothetical protein